MLFREPHPFRIGGLAVLRACVPHDGVRLSILSNSMSSSIDVSASLLSIAEGQAIRPG
jgi:hypothetical protein